MAHDTESGAGADVAVASPSLRTRLLAALWVLLLRLQRASWRIRCAGLEAFDAALASRRPLLAVFWHGKYIPLFVLLEGRRAVVFTSRSRRGSVIAEICRRFGYQATLVPERQRQHSLEIMRRRLAETGAGGIAADGPRGPYHVVKPGPVTLASELGMAIFPVSVAAEPKKVLTGRWDHMELPRFFARVALVVSEPLVVPAGLEGEALTAWQERLHHALDETDRQAGELLEGARGEAELERRPGDFRAL